jgi:tetratricopeptide (TPR) repeat protein
LGYLGVIAQLRGRVEKALVRFDEALDSTRGRTPARTEAYFRAYHGGLLARLGRSDEAYTSWRRAERLLEGSSDSMAGVLIKLTQAQGWRLDEDRHADIQALINRMHQPEGSEPSLHQRNEDIRIAVRLLEAG